jgi:hypothetical protein
MLHVSFVESEVDFHLFLRESFKTAERECTWGVGVHRINPKAKSKNNECEYGEYTTIAI